MMKKLLGYGVMTRVSISNVLNLLKLRLYKNRGMLNCLLN